MSREGVKKSRQGYLDSVYSAEVGERLINSHLKNKSRFSSDDIVDKFHQVLKIVESSAVGNIVQLGKSSEVGWEIRVYLWIDEDTSYSFIYTDSEPFGVETVFYMNNFDKYLEKLMEFL